MNKRDHVLNAILLAVGLGYVFEPSGDVETFWLIAELSVPIVLGALVPDIDTAFGRHRKTLHNLPVLALALAYPLYFGNLEWVWIGIATHYLLDVLGSRRGIALFYPVWAREFGAPVGVLVSSRFATPVTLVVTVLELALAVVIVHDLF
ncbi:metal-dependent hydrolase [Natronorarus salvus]|uniref:metal-dependent hydrolase n=1 Tax=Natronorarus salvus TaxID=3117733 RepID=UPI002F25F4BB